MENKKININNINSIVKNSNLNVPKKNNSNSFTMNPQMAKLFISGMLKKGGMSDEKIKNTLCCLDSKIKKTNPKKEESLNNEKEIKDNIIVESNIDKKEKDDISTENKDSGKSLESTK